MNAKVERQFVSEIGGRIRMRPNELSDARRLLELLITVLSSLLAAGVVHENLGNLGKSQNCHDLELKSFQISRQTFSWNYPRLRFRVRTAQSSAANCQ